MLIDWDNAAPGSRLWELASSAQAMAGLRADRPPRESARRLRAFVDVGGLTQASFRNTSECNTGTQSCVITDSAAPRVGAGVGISWRTAFGLINIDLTPFVIKQAHDQTQIFRFGFGTRF